MNSKSQHRTGFTLLLVVIYTAFFLVHSVFKLSCLGAQPSVQSVYKNSSKCKDELSKPLLAAAKKETKKILRLNKRFHPETGPLAPEITLEKPIYRLMGQIKNFYENPTQQRVMLGRSLRAPPTYQA